MSIILYMLITPAFYYLGSRAMITAPVWSRYPPGFAKFADCAMCSGTWYGAFVGLIGGYGCGLSFLGLPGNAGGTVIAIALCSMTWTPIIAALMHLSFQSLGDADLEASDETIEQETDHGSRD